MKRVFSGVIGLPLMLAACANNGSEPEKAEAPRQAAQASSAAVEEQEMTKERAERLAQTHLSLKKVSWGDAQEVVEDENRFLVHYETPERELRLLGQRTLIVEKGSGLVTYQKRR